MNESGSGLSIAEAVMCKDIECPWQETATIPAGCVIPYFSTPDEYCLSTKIGFFATISIGVSVMLYMVGIGCQLDLKLMKESLKTPKPVFVAFFAQTVLNPLALIAILELIGQDFPTSIKIMGLLIASASGGQGSNFLTFLAYGDVETSVVCTAFSTLMAVGTMPFWIFIGLQILWKDDAVDLGIDFKSIILAVLAATMLPAFGLLLKYKLSEKIARYWGTYGLTAGIILSVLNAGIFLFDPVFMAGLTTMSYKIWICTLLLNIAGLLLGYFSALVFCLPEMTRRMVAFEVASQNVSISLGVVVFTYGAGPVSALFSPFVGAYLITALVNWVFVAYFRFIRGKPEDYDERRNGITIGDDVDTKSENDVVVSVEVHDDE